MKALITIEGNENIMNSGNVLGNIVKGNQVQNTNIIINMHTIEEKIIEKKNEVLDLTSNISKINLRLPQSIHKQAENENKSSDTILHLVKAVENNSKATLLISESIKKDKELIERLIDIIEVNGNL